MNLKTSALVAAALFVVYGCRPGAKLSKTKVRNLETVTVVANKTDTVAPTVAAKYNSSVAQINDLIHTKLEVSFDWQKQHLLGKATLILKPYFYPTDSLRLDAKGFAINKITLLANNTEIPLTYTYTDGANLYIKLNKTYSRTEEYTIFIDYTAKPNEMPTGGSSAITSDKGLYFINPLGEEAGKPQQIWTQGETEASSKWFPTIDRPNQRCTQEIYITVENKYRTLSNGLLKSSTNNPNNTRTDYWVMDKPHTPYLFMMTVGEFALVKDEWNGMLLEYYVEPKYEKDAKAIYPYTGEMLTFFSNKFGYKYPWQKYSQIVVRDYVSGAMENTTAVIFGDFIQKTAREIADEPELNEGIVAHEMMHHWFGDLVTCESWSNLPLNESFANYSEYLWLEHKHGRDAADHHRMGDITGYMRQANMQNDMHPLIYFGYNDKEDMFDSHSYNKGGAILHMLRQYLGDDAYFQSLKYYLTKHEYTAVEVHDLRLAFEDVTGQDLNWFFNQWFFNQGHPDLDIQRKYDATKKEVTITILQTQDFSKVPLFILPFYIDIYTDYNKPAQRYWVKMDKAQQSFTFATDKPIWVAVDANRDLLCERKEYLETAEYIAQYKLGKTFLDRYTAINKLKDRQTQDKEAAEILIAGLDDKFWAIRESAIDAIDKKAIKGELADKLKKIAQSDPRPNVRVAAIQRLAATKDKANATLFQDIMKKDQSYNVIGTALEMLAEFDKDAALVAAKNLENETQIDLLMGVARVYASTKDKQYNNFFQATHKNVDGYAAFSFFSAYADYVTEIKDKEFSKNNLTFLKNTVINYKSDVWQRYGAASCVKKIKDFYREEANGNDIYQLCIDILAAAKSGETNKMLLKAYDKF